LQKSRAVGRGIETQLVRIPVLPVNLLQISPSNTS